MFLTLEDPNAKIKGSRDPLGAQPLWASFGWNEILEWLESVPRGSAEGTLTRTSIRKGGDDRRNRHGGCSHTIRNEGKNVGCRLPKT